MVFQRANGNSAQARTNVKTRVYWHRYIANLLVTVLPLKELKMEAYIPVKSTNEIGGLAMA